MNPMIEALMKAGIVDRKNAEKIQRIKDKIAIIGSQLEYLREHKPTCANILILENKRKELVS